MCHQGVSLASRVQSSLRWYYSKFCRKEKEHKGFMKSECIIAEQQKSQLGLATPSANAQHHLQGNIQLLAANKTCPNCSQFMQWEARTDISDKFRWRCPDAGCRKTLSIRDGSFLSKSQLLLLHWAILLYWWVREYPVMAAMEEAKSQNPRTQMPQINGFVRFAQLSLYRPP